MDPSTASSEKVPPPDPPFEKPPWYLWPNLLCLDAPLISLLWFFLLAKCHRLMLEPSVPWVLGLTVFAIYVFDRWVDNLRENPSTPRHRFLKTKAGLFLRLAGLAAVACAGWLSLSEMPADLLFTGLFLVAMVGFYFGLIQIPANRSPAVGLAAAVGGLAAAILLSRGSLLLLFTDIRVVLALLLFILGPIILTSAPQTRLGMKEMAAGLLFALGTFLPAYFHHRLGVFFLFGLLTLLFGFLCALNIAAVAAREEMGTEKERPRPMEPILLGLLTAGGLALASTFHQNGGNRGPESTVALCISASAVLLFLLHLTGNRLSKNAHRVLVDAALLTPVIPLLLFMA